MCVPHAKVPIVKIWDPEHELACDMNVNNTLALENTRMIKTYVEIDDRVRPLAMIIKHWTKQRVLNDAGRWFPFCLLYRMQMLNIGAALGGTLSSYTWICMILNFLQTRNPPVLPCLHKRPHQRLVDSNGKPSSFADDINTLRGWGGKNKETLGELLFHFFRRYAHEVDYERNVVSVREGKLISKEAKKWHLMQNNRLCVEEPFNTERNLGNTADDISFRGVHLELRRAFDLVSEAKLEECIELYTFPPTEEKIWERPPPKPMPVLSRSRSQSQTSRGGKPTFAGRAGKNLSGQHRSGMGRRASSAATTMNKFGGPQIGARGIPSQDHPLQVHFQQMHLHDHLFNEYQILQAQEQELRAIQAQAQLHNQNQAQAQLHNQNQAQGASMTAPLPYHNSREHLDRPAMANQVPFSAPLRSGAFPHPFAYQTASGIPRQSVHTNPSSPSTKSAQPELRRSVNRSSNTDTTSSPNLRSHSQPARPLPLGLAVQNMQALPFNANDILQYHQLRHQQQLINYAVERNQSRQRHSDQAQRRQMQQDLGYDESHPKEYIGYYVHDSPPSRLYRDDHMGGRIPAYNDLSHRYRGMPANIGRWINPPRSRSPSPSLALRDRSFSMRSASSAPAGPMTLDRNQLSKPGYRSSGPIIVDGSSGWGLHEVSPAVNSSALSSALGSSRSQLASPTEEQIHEASARTAEMIYHGQGRRGSYGYESSQFQNPHTNPDLGRTSHASRNGIIESLKRRTTNHAKESIAASLAAKRSDNKVGEHGLGIDFETPVKGPCAEEKPSTLQNSGPQIAPNQTTEMNDEVSDQRYDQSTKPPPLLSPVREVRTPSPTTKRKDDLFIAGPHVGRIRAPLQLDIPPFSAIMYAKQKQIDVQAQRPNGIPSHQPESPKSGQSLQSNGWQQPTKKGKKNKLKTQASQHPIIMPGEPLPLNEAERKGG